MTLHSGFRYKVGIAMHLNPRIPKRLLAGIFLLLFLPWSVSHAKDKEPKSYPETGTVLEMHIAERTYTAGVYTDPYGKTHGGNSTDIRRPVYKLETEKRFYDLEGRRRDRLEIGTSVRFRIEKDWAYVQQGSKEMKLRIVGDSLKPGT
jgi:hypothetical protein